MTDLLPPEKEEKKYVVLARGRFHQGAMHGMITGGGTLPSTCKKFAFKIIPLANNFGGWELLACDMGDTIKFEKYTRHKVIHVKGTTSNEVKDAAQKELAEESMF